MKPELKVVNETLDHCYFSIMGVREKYFGLVDHQVRADPDKQVLIYCGLKDHVFIEHKMSIPGRKFMADFGNHTSIFKGVLGRMEIPELLDGAVSVVIVPDFLNVIEMLSEDDFECALKVVGLSFLEEFEFMFGLDGDRFADFGLFHNILGYFIFYQSDVFIFLGIL